MASIHETAPPRKGHLTRRRFLSRTAKIAAGAVAAPYIIPGRALGQEGARSANDRIVMGCIGVGSQGTGNMKQFLGLPDLHIVAVCDVDKNHRDEAKAIVDQAYGNSDCATYNDFRELLERPDLDAVSIAVPDHWHAIPAVAAADRGLDIYAEKPLALTIYEGRKIVDACERNGTVWQTGSWQRSQSHFRRACELVRNGYIGEVHTVKVGLPTGKPIGPQPEMPVPPGFDYDFWLGPAPWEPYTEQRCHWNFRWILDYSGGQLTDWAAHHCDIANWGMGTEFTGPRHVSGTGVFPRDGLWDAATDYMVEAQFGRGASPVAPGGFKMLVSNSFPMGARFEGSEGWVYVNRGNEFETEPGSLKDIDLGANDVRLYESRHHGQNFVDSVRSRELTVAPVSPAHHAITIAHLGNIAMRLERAVEWDPERERFINDPTADRMLKRAMRGHWQV